MLTRAIRPVLNTVTMIPTSEQFRVVGRTQPIPTSPNDSPEELRHDQTGAVEMPEFDEDSYTSNDSSEDTEPYSEKDSDVPYGQKQPGPIHAHEQDYFQYDRSDFDNDWSDSETDREVMSITAAQPMQHEVHRYVADPSATPNLVRPVPVRPRLRPEQEAVKNFREPYSQRFESLASKGSHSPTLIKEPAASSAEKTKTSMRGMGRSADKRQNRDREHVADAVRKGDTTRNEEYSSKEHYPKPIPPASTKGVRTGLTPARDPDHKSESSTRTRRQGASERKPENTVPPKTKSTATQQSVRTSSLPGKQPPQGFVRKKEHSPPKPTDTRDKAAMPNGTDPKSTPSPKTSLPSLTIQRGDLDENSDDEDIHLIANKSRMRNMGASTVTPDVSAPDVSTPVCTDLNDAPPEPAATSLPPALAARTPKFGLVTPTLVSGSPSHETSKTPPAVTNMAGAALAEETRSVAADSFTFSKEEFTVQQEDDHQEEVDYDAEARDTQDEHDNDSNVGMGDDDVSGYTSALSEDSRRAASPSSQTRRKAASPSSQTRRSHRHSEHSGARRRNSGNHRAREDFAQGKRAGGHESEEDANDDHRRTKSKNDLKYKLHREELQMKKLLLRELHNLENGNPPIMLTQTYDMDDDLSEIRLEYQRAKYEKDLAVSTKINWNRFFMANSLIEMALTKFVPSMKMKGWCDELTKMQQDLEPYFMQGAKKMVGWSRQNPTKALVMMTGTQLATFAAPRVMNLVQHLFMKKDPSKASTNEHDPSPSQRSQELREIVEKYELLHKRFDEEKKELHKILKQQSDTHELLARQVSSVVELLCQRGASAKSTPTDTNPGPRSPEGYDTPGGYTTSSRPVRVDSSGSSSRGNTPDRTHYTPNTPPPGEPFGKSPVFTTTPPALAGQRSESLTSSDANQLLTKLLSSSTAKPGGTFDDTDSSDDDDEIDPDELIRLRDQPLIVPESDGSVGQLFGQMASIVASNMAANNNASPSSQSIPEQFRTGTGSSISDPAIAKAKRGSSLSLDDLLEMPTPTPQNQPRSRSSKLSSVLSMKET